MKKIQIIKGTMSVTDAEWNKIYDKFYKGQDTFHLSKDKSMLSLAMTAKWVHKFLKGRFV